LERNLAAVAQLQYQLTHSIVGAVNSGLRTQDSGTVNTARNW
jgi:hypothetical protein